MTALGTIRAQLAAARASLDAVEASVSALEPKSTEPVVDEHLDLKQLDTEYALKRDAVVAAHGRGELLVVRGARRKLFVKRSEVERWLRSRPVHARQRTKPEAANDSAESWEAEQSKRLAGRAR